MHNLYIFFSCRKHSFLCLSSILKPFFFHFYLKVIFCYSHMNVVNSEVSSTSGNIVMLNLQFSCDFQILNEKLSSSFLLLLSFDRIFAICETGTFTFHIFSFSPYVHCFICAFQKNASYCQWSKYSKWHLCVSKCIVIVILHIEMMMHETQRGNECFWRQRVSYPNIRNSSSTYLHVYFESFANSVEIICWRFGKQ